MIHNVTLVRLISTYILVAYHGREMLLRIGFGDAELDSMRAGTDLFIVCSAFLTTHVNSRKAISAGEFLRKRLVRIVPLYWVMTLVVFALVLVFPNLAVSTRSHPGDLVKSLLFIPYMKESHHVQPIVFVAWTLNLIMLFSIIYAIGLAVAGTRRAWIAAMVMVGALVAAGAAWPMPSVALQFYTDALLAEFLLGLLISRFAAGLARTAYPGANRGLDIACCFVVAGFACAAVAARPYLWPDAHRTVAYGLPCALLLCVAIRLDAHGISARSPTLQRLAGYSYAIYLSHFFATAFFSLILQKYTSETSAIALMLLVVTLVVSTVVGIILNRVVERPLVALFEQSSLGWRERVEAVLLRPAAAAAERLRPNALAKRHGRP